MKARIPFGEPGLPFGLAVAVRSLTALLGAPPSLPRSLPWVVARTFSPFVRGSDPPAPRFSTTFTLCRPVVYCLVAPGVRGWGARLALPRALACRGGMDGWHLRRDRLEGGERGWRDFLGG
jgi:hypothetical protein